MEYTHTCSKMALADVVDESIANEKIMEEMITPMISEDMYLSDALFTKFEFDETFQFQDLYLPDVAEPVTQGPPGPPGILRHDCMWNGTCIDKDHDYKFRNHCKERNQRSNKANNNRSLLISNSKIEKRKNTTTSINKKTIKKMLNNKQDEYNCQTSDSELPCTPPDSDSDNEIPSFKHEININEKLSECMNEFDELFSVSEVTGQSIVYETDNNNNNNNRYFGGRKMMNISKQEMNNDDQTSDEDDDEEDEEEEEEEDSDDHEEEEVEEQVNNIKTSTNENINSAIIQNNKEMQQNTLNDHCYYTQNVNTKKFDNLGVCTPSDSEEEIDVVTFEKPSKPSLPTFPSIAEQKSFQMTVNNALIKPAPRPRGRPPLNSNNNNNNNNINNNINIINNNIININTINNINNINTINNNNTNIISNNNIINNNNNNNIINNYNNNNNANSRKRVVQEQKQNKRAKQSNPYQRKPKVEKNIPMNKLPIIEPIIYKQEPIFKQEPMNDYEGNDFHSDDEPETDKRNLHNNMERQRRIELKDSFEFLRRLVPDLIEIDKAPKVKILNTAAIYCEKLTVRYNELDHQKRELVKTQLRLKETVSKLRRKASERFLSRAQ